MEFKILNKINKYFYPLLFGNVKYGRRLGVKIGENCRIYIKDFGSEPFLIEIGNNVTVGFGTTFINHDGSRILINDDKGRRYVYKKIKIEDNVFIGVRSIIMPGVKIGKNVIVGAGSVVTKSIPDNSVVAGVPAKFICSFHVYREKSLKNSKAETELDKNIDYKSRILKIVSSDFNDYLDESN